MLGTSLPRVLIADDHALIGEAFNKLLSSDFEVVATVQDGRSLMIAAERLRPDVILVDIGMPVLNGLEAAQRIKRILPDVKVIYVTINHDPSLIEEAFRRGASGYLSKMAAASELVKAIHHALSGDHYVSPLLSNYCLKSSTSSREFASAKADLTERQVEVLQLLAEGKSMKEAAAILNLTTRTVAFHKYRIMQTLQLRNDAEVVQYAMHNHVIFS